MTLGAVTLKAEHRVLISLVAMTALALFLSSRSHAESNASPTIAEHCQQAAARGRTFLSGLIDPELGLLPEFPGADRYWLWHDNYIAARVLASTHPEVSRTIVRAMEREGDSSTDGKMELALGETKSVLPLRSYDLLQIRRVDKRRIFNERPTDRLMTGAEKYADLLFYVAMSSATSSEAQRHWQTALEFWDGKDFADAAYVHERHVYTTFKLALALIASRQLTERHGQTFDLPEAVRDRLLTLQNDAGGWFTNYDRDGTPRGKANVETTSLAVLGIDASLK